MSARPPHGMHEDRTVVVADADSAFRTGVVELLEREVGIRAVPAATTDVLLRLVNELRPAVVLADTDPVAGGGVEAIARVKRRSPMTEAARLPIIAFDGVQGAHLGAGTRHVRMISAIAPM